MAVEDRNQALQQAATIIGSLGPRIVKLSQAEMAELAIMVTNSLLLNPQHPEIAENLAQNLLAEKEYQKDILDLAKEAEEKAKKMLEARNGSASMTDEEKKRVLTEALNKLYEDMSVRLDSLHTMYDALDERKKRRGIWDFDDMEAAAVQDPKAFREHMIEAMAEAEIRREIIHRQEEIIQTQEDVTIGLAKQENIHAKNIEDLQVKLDALSTDRRSEASIQNIDTKTKQVIKNKLKIKENKKELKLLDREVDSMATVATKHDIALPSVTELKDKTDQIGQEDHIDQDIVKVAKGKLVDRHEKMEDQQKELEERLEEATSLGETLASLYNLEGESLQEIYDEVLKKHSNDQEMQSDPMVAGFFDLAAPFCAPSTQGKGASTEKTSIPEGVLAEALNNKITSTEHTTEQPGNRTPHGDRIKQQQSTRNNGIVQR